MQIIDLAQGDDQWLEWRKEGVTATDAVILSGRSPYKTRWRLWAEKVGFAKAIDLSGNPLVRYGKEMEPVARQAAEKHFGDLLLPVCVQSSFDSLVRASLDGLNSKNEPVELKCPSKKVWDEVCTLGTKSQAYQMYWVQCQYQMLATGSEKSYLVFWFEGNIKVFEILADKPFLLDLYEKVKSFWALVQTRVEPAKDLKEDLYIPTGSEAEQWIVNAQAFKAIDAQIKDLQNRIEDLKAGQKESLDSLKALMGDYYRADYAGVMVTRYHTEGSVDYQQLLHDKAQDIRPEDIEKYRKKSSERWRITVSESNLPRTIIEPSVLEPLEKEASQDVEMFYF